LQLIGNGSPGGLMSLELFADMQHASVVKLFKEQIGHYSSRDQAVDSKIVSLFKGWVRKDKVNKHLEICEFGGGAGQLLSQLRENYHNASFTNAEIVEDYKKKLVSDKIKFVKTSIIKSVFTDKSFDVLIARDVFHHLIGKSYDETVKNQITALNELKRLLRPGGVIFIEELTMIAEITSRAIYTLSSFNARLGLRLPFINISTNTVVAFLTKDKLIRFCKQVFVKEKIYITKINIKNDFKSRILRLGNKADKIIVTIQ